jgi:hypothetical protein
MEQSNIKVNINKTKNTAVEFNTNRKLYVMGNGKMVKKMGIVVLFM